MPHPAHLARVEIGLAKVTYLPDGSGALNAVALFPGTSVEAWAPYRRYLNEEGGLVTTLGGYYIETGDHALIIDTGFGPTSADYPGFGPMSGGTYLESLAAAGVDPARVTEVLFSHMHLDHVGWTTVETAGERHLLFPNAQHWVHRTEWEFWIGRDDPFGPDRARVLQPLSGRIRFFDDGDELVPGLRVIGTHGHTPGHSSFLLQGGDERLLITADTFTSPVQAIEPSWTIAFDIDPAAAVSSRLRILAEAAQPGTLAAANHFADQVFGRFERTADGYVWVPLE